MNAHIYLSVAIVVCSLFLVCPVARGQEPEIKTTLAEDLVRTFGFCYSQRLSLKQLRQKFPDMEAQIMLTEMQWDNAFEEAEFAVEARLKALVPKQWEEKREKMFSDFEPTIRQQNSKANREIAGQFLKVVQQRAKGALESPNREILLSSHPKFVKSPELEFTTGYIGAFASKGHSKAKGVELSVRYPLSWKQYEADRPNIVQKWISGAGHGTDVFMIHIRKLSELPTPEEKAEFFTEAFANTMFEDGGKPLSYITKRLERQSVGIVHFTQTTERLDLTIDTRGVFYYLIHEDAFIALQFMCYTPGGADAREARIKQLEPLVKAIVNSLVLSTKYK